MPKSPEYKRSLIFQMPDPDAGADRPDYVPPEITQEARIYIWDELARNPEDNRVVARGQVAGKVAERFGVSQSVAIRWVIADDPVRFRPILRAHGYDLVRLPIGPNPYLRSGPKDDQDEE
ncbi:hypothetical protein [Adonisia turfae]